MNTISCSRVSNYYGQATAYVLRWANEPMHLFVAPEIAVLIGDQRVTRVAGQDIEDLRAKLFG